MKFYFEKRTHSVLFGLSLTMDIHLFLAHLSPYDFLLQQAKAPPRTRTWTQRVMATNWPGLFDKVYISYETYLLLSHFVLIWELDFYTRARATVFGSTCIWLSCSVSSGGMVHVCTDRNVRGIFPHIWWRAQVQSHIWRKYFSPYMTENSPRFSLNMTKISILGENSPQMFPTYDENIWTRGKIPPDFP